MPAASISAQTVPITGIAAAYSAADAGGQKFLNDGKKVVHVKNASGSPITVTPTATKTITGATVSGAAVTVAAGAEKFIGPFPTDTFNDTDGYATVQFSLVTSVTVAVLDVPHSP